MNIIYKQPIVSKVEYTANVMTVEKFAPSCHIEPEIIYLLSGKASITVGNKKYNLIPDSFVIIDSAIVHSIESRDKDSKCLAIKIGEGLIGKGYAKLCETEVDKKFWSGSKKDDRCSPLFDTLKKIATIIESTTITDSSVREHNLKSCMYSFRNQFLSTERSDASVNKLRQRKDFIAMQEVYAFAKDNFNNQISVDEMAEKAGYEKTRFCQLYKKIFGISFHQFLNEKRIEYAKKLIVKKNSDIDEICILCGFSEVKTFTRVFKEQTGLTPKKYKSTHSK